MENVMSFFKKISDLFVDETFLLQMANACDKAYADGTGNSGRYSEFASDEWGSKVQGNLAAIFAVDACCTMAAMDSDASIRVEDGKSYLNEDIRSIVTKVLQTAAGRMIFARPEEG